MRRLYPNPDLDPSTVADAIDRQISALADQSTGPVRIVRREWSGRLRRAPGADVLAIADALVPRQRWVGYELIDAHRGAREALDVAWVERLGRGIDSWVAVDTFGRFISGMAWQRRQIPDEAVERWAASADRWWRRAALVSTVPLNLRAAGGMGDSARTLSLCRLLVADRDDMVVKAMSWALRQLVEWDPDAVRAFIAGEPVAARVRREVTTKLETGHKNRPRGRAGGILPAMAAADGLVEEISHYGNGKVKYRGFLLDGVMHGDWTWYRTDGSLMRTGSFDRGRQIGAWRTYDRDSRVVKDTTFDD